MKASLVLILYLKTCGAFLEDIKDTLGSAKTYLDQVLPMISDGLKAVKKFEEFVDNTIEEDCYFECPVGKVIKPNDNHVVTSNGCGSLDIIFDDSENSLIHVEKEFSECCGDHDECYDTCGEDKDLCDHVFTESVERMSINIFWTTRSANSRPNFSTWL